MGKLIGIILAALFSLTVFVQAYAQPHHFTPERRKAIDTFIAERMAIDHIPGVSVVLVEDGQVISYLVKGLTGNAQEPVTPATIFALGSVSKSFTGLAILQFAEEGRLDFDDPVVQHLPWFQTKDPSRSDQITIRQLLNHTSGLSSYDGNTLLADRRRTAVALESSVRRLANIELYAEPGTAFSYSNDNYRILGLILEVLEEAPYEDVIQRRVFDVLDMRASRFFGMGELGVAVPHRYWLTRPRPHQIPLGSSNNPETGVYTSGVDMGAYLTALTGGNETTPNFWRQALAEGPTLGSGNRYSIGFESHGPLEEPILLHGGWNAGFMARIGFDPTRRIGFAIMTNAGRGYVAGDIDLLTKGALALALDVEPIGPKTYAEERVILGGLIGLMMAIGTWIAIFLHRLRAGKIKAHRTRWQRAVKDIGPSAALGVTAWVALKILPYSFETTISGLRLFHPDLGWALISFAGACLLWAVARPFLIWRRS